MLNKISAFYQGDKVQEHYQVLFLTQWEQLLDHHNILCIPTMPPDTDEDSTKEDISLQ